MTRSSSVPTKIILHAVSASLEIAFDEQETYLLAAEFLRVLSPSAEVQGHGNPILQVGKKEVRILEIQSVGNYAVRLVFSDGHDSGIYSWSYLRRLGQEQDSLWQQYLNQLKIQGASR